MLIKEVASPIDLRKPEDAVQWASEVNIKRPWRYAFFDYYAELIQQSNARNILEIGAGPGYLAKHLLERCPNIHYTAFDFSEAMHDLSRNRLLANELQRTRYVVGDFKQPDWVDHSLDTISSLCIKLCTSYAIKHMQSIFITL